MFFLFKENTNDRTCTVYSLFFYYYYIELSANPQRHQRSGSSANGNVQRQQMIPRTGDQWAELYRQVNLTRPLSSSLHSLFGEPLFAPNDATTISENTLPIWNTTATGTQLPPPPAIANRLNDYWDISTTAGQKDTTVLCNQPLRALVWSILKNAKTDGYVELFWLQD